MWLINERGCMNRCYLFWLLASLSKCVLYLGEITMRVVFWCWCWWAVCWQRKYRVYFTRCLIVRLPHLLSWGAIECSRFLFAVDCTNRFYVESNEHVLMSQKLFSMKSRSDWNSHNSFRDHLVRLRFQSNHFNFENTWCFINWILKNNHT